MSPNLWCPSLTQKFTRKTKLRHGREKWKVKEGAGRRPPQFPTRGPSPQIVCPIFSLNAQQRSSPLWCGGDYCAIAIYGVDSRTALCLTLPNTIEKILLWWLFCGEFSSREKSSTGQVGSWGTAMIIWTPSREPVHQLYWPLQPQNPPLTSLFTKTITQTFPSLVAASEVCK